MSVKHPIIAITGSSGAGTTSVKMTFEQIFRREKINSVYIEGDAFHRWSRTEMREKMKEAAARGDNHYSHFGPDANLFEELDRTFSDYARKGTGKTRTYIHDAAEAELHGSRRAYSRRGESWSLVPTCCFMRACTVAWRPETSMCQNTSISRSASCR